MHAAGSADIPVGSTDATILLVDDEPAVRQMLTDLLGMRGYRVLPARDAEEALVLAAGCGPDGPRVLVTDLRLPGLSGQALATRLRQDHPELAVIFISGYTDDIVADPARMAPRCCILEKPFRTARLLELISELLA